MTNKIKIIKIPEGPRDKSLSYDKGVNVGSKAGVYKNTRTPFAPTGSAGGNTYKAGGGKIKMSNYYSAGGKVYTGR